MDSKAKMTGPLAAAGAVSVGLVIIGACGVGQEDTYVPPPPIRSSSGSAEQVRYTADISTSVTITQVAIPPSPTWRMAPEPPPRRTLPPEYRISSTETGTETETEDPTNTTRSRSRRDRDTETESESPTQSTIGLRVGEPAVADPGALPAPPPPEPAPAAAPAPPGTSTAPAEPSVVPAPPPTPESTVEEPAPVPESPTGSAPVSPLLEGSTAPTETPAPQTLPDATPQDPGTAGSPERTAPVPTTVTITVPE